VAKGQLKEFETGPVIIYGEHSGDQGVWAFKGVRVLDLVRLAVGYEEKMDHACTGSGRGSISPPTPRTATVASSPGRSCSSIRPASCRWLPTTESWSRLRMQVPDRPSSGTWPWWCPRTATAARGRSRR
jgi:hypothetical protein